MFTSALSTVKLKRFVCVRHGTHSANNTFKLKSIASIQPVPKLHKICRNKEHERSVIYSSWMMWSLTFKLIINNLIFIAYFICSVSFFVQTFMITVSYIWPERTTTVSFQEDLNFKDLPILIKVCPIPGFDEDELFDAGYLNTANYFRGISQFNS